MTLKYSHIVHLGNLLMFCFGQCLQAFHFLTGIVLIPFSILSLSQPYGECLRTTPAQHPSTPSLARLYIQIEHFTTQKCMRMFSLTDLTLHDGPLLFPRFY